VTNFTESAIGRTDGGNSLNRMPRQVDRTNAELPRLVLFSGIGIGPQLYGPQRVLPVRVITPEWIDARDGETLAQYARRMAADVEPGWADAPLYLGGVSFGGMIALEAARVLNPQGVFLIGSCYSHRHLSAPVRLVGRMVPHMPPAMIALSLMPAPLMFRVVGRPDRRQRQVLMDLVRQPNVPQIRWGARAIMEWEFAGPPPFPVHQIHGGDDYIVPVSGVRPGLVVPGAGHVVNLTHAEVVNRFLVERMGLRAARPTDRPPRGGAGASSGTESACPKTPAVRR
jgi:pimeloyl-ACP methyl ester carboxylesterase